MTEIATGEKRIAFRTAFTALLLVLTLTVASSCEGGVQSTETPTATTTPTAAPTATATPTINFAHDDMDVFYTRVPTNSPTPLRMETPHP